MSPAEVALRLQKKTYQFSDKRYVNDYEGSLEPSTAFPKLPAREAVPPELLRGLRAQVDEILRGEWRAFGHLPIKVDDPPKWQSDCLVGRDFQSGQSAFKLDHRAQPGGADIKVIWEPSRWSHLVRLAAAAWLLNDARAQEKCIEWLFDWAKRNPPFTGLNWTSGLETGIRLIQFVWIDAFLMASGTPHKTLEELRRLVLPPHVSYTWRYRSFGSSANNHLIGELAGIILATARWPQLASLSASAAQVSALLDKEVLLQFAADGGNKEQALSYHLFSFEFCWQSARALEAAGHPLSSDSLARLRRAGEFYALSKPQNDPWDFGDSDNAWVTPLFADERNYAAEWWRWFDDSAASPALRFWWGDFPRVQRRAGEWRIFESSGLAVLESGDWFVRLDFSPLGYLSIAPHGHLDALHVSIWHKGRPVVIDPGTGAYYADKLSREYLAGWSAHNSPQLKTPPEVFPKRAGVFLWTQHHAIPKVERLSPLSLRAEIKLPFGTAVRTVVFDASCNGIRISDDFVRSAPNAVVVTRWKFAPELRLSQAASGRFALSGGAGPLRFECSSAWHMARTFNPPEELRGKVAPTLNELGNVPLESVVSPAFRSVACAPYLALESAEAGPFEVTISAE